MTPFRDRTKPFSAGRLRFAILASLACPRIALADVASAQALEIVCAAPQPACDAFRAASGRLLTERAGVTFRRGPSETSPEEPPIRADREPQARIHIAASDTGPIRIATSWLGGPPVVRTVEADALTPVTIETVAQIVRETVHVLSVEMSTPAAAAWSKGDHLSLQSARKNPPLPAAPPRAPTFEVTLGYVSRAIVSGSGFGGLGLRQHGGFAHFSAYLSDATLTRLHPVLSAALELSRLGDEVKPTNKFGWRLMAGLSWHAAPAFHISCAAGFGMDHFDNAPNGNVAPAARGELVASVGLPLPVSTNRVRLSLGMTVDLLPAYQHLQTAEGGTKRIQPGGFIGLGWAFW